MKKHIITITALLFFAISCSEDFLDRKSLTSLSDDTFWKSENDAILGVTGCYDVLQSYWLYNSNHWAGGYFYYESFTDNANVVWDWQQGYFMARNTHTVTQWLISMTWSASYNAITRSNKVIEMVSKMTPDQIDPKKQAEIVAEAKFIRALIYNNMVLLWEDIPLITSVVPASKTEIPKNKKAEVVKFISDDLAAAVESLPITRPDTEYGRVTRGAGYALLARINLWHGNYTASAEWAKKVMDLGAYGLYPNFEKLFKAANEKNNEVIFPVCYQRGPNDDGAQFVGTWDDSPWFWLTPLKNLAADFYCTDGKSISQSPLYDANNVILNRDPRFNGTLTTNGSLWGGVVLSEDKYGSTTGYNLRKWKEETGFEDRFDSPQDFYVFRYAHILLIRAEALVQSGNTGAEVYNLINSVRDRVNMPHVESVEGAGLPKDKLMEVIKHEWRVETAFEGLRYFDLKRWGDLKKEAVDKFNAVDKTANPLEQRLWYPRSIVWPIPQDELDKNKAIEQHELWK